MHLFWICGIYTLFQLSAARGELERLHQEHNSTVKQSEKGNGDHHRLQVLLFKKYLKMKKKNTVTP